MANTIQPAQELVILPVNLMGPGN